MSRRRPDTVVTLRNGDVIRKTITTHRDGKISIRRKKIACGIRHAGPIDRPLDEVEILAVPKLSKTEKRKSKKLALPTPKRRVFRERMHHKSTKYQAGAYIEELKVAYVMTTNEVHRLLRGVGARNGSHIEQFQRDHELLESGLRSVSFDSSPGGGAIPVPLARIQAQDRLKEFAAVQPAAARVCKALLVDGVPLDKFPVPRAYGKKGGGGRNRMVQDAVDELARFYVPKRTRPDRSLIEFDSLIEKARRIYESGK